jgi:multicomponent Na+:H+ antiporter subunit C
VIGLGLLSNGTHLMLLSTGGLEAGGAPVLHEAGGAVVDPLPQALILTAIVISFGVTALLLTISYGTFASYRSDDLGELHGRLDDE